MKKISAVLCVLLLLLFATSVFSSTDEGSLSATQYFWQCSACGQRGPTTRTQTPPSQTFGGKCKGTPTGYHVWVIVGQK